MRIVWGTPEETSYEAGCSKAVVYVDGGVGVAWQGLLSVDESAESGLQESFYFDGIKTFNFVGSRDFKAKLTVFDYPREFLPCIGEVEVAQGFIMTRQMPKPFHICYRTEIGDSGEYKIHLVYDSIARKPSRSYQTITSAVVPDKKDIDIYTRPPAINSVKPTGHLVVDSRYTPAAKMTAIENAVYGTATTDPAMPSVSSLVAMFS